MKNRSASIISQFEELARTAESPERIQGFLSLSAKPSQYVQFRQFLVYGIDGLVSALERRFRKYSNGFQSVNQEAGVFELRRTYGRRNQHKENGYVAVLPGGHPNFYRITTISYSRFWEDVVKYYLHKSYPILTTLVFKQQELRRALAALEFSLGSNYRIVISDATLREKARLGQKRQDTERWWTRLPFQEVFDEAYERGQWFKKLQFVVEKEREKRPGRYEDIAFGRLSKRGEVKYDWFYEEINAAILTTLEDNAFHRMNLLNNRGVKERNYLPSKPIVIQFSTDLFSELENVREFGLAISKYPNSTKAVLHSNPYYHASVADFLDGSSFEVWVLSSDRVILVPQAKSSEQAFERLIGHIFTEFREGDISEYVR